MYGIKVQLVNYLNIFEPIGQLPWANKQLGTPNKYTPWSHSTNGEFPTSKMLGLEDFYRFFLEWWNLAGENLLETDLSNKKTYQHYHGVWTKIWPPTWDVQKGIQLRKWWDQLPTSTGARFWKHHQALKKLREGFPIRPERVNPSPFCQDHVGGWYHFKHVYI